MFECLSSYFLFISLVPFANQFHCFIGVPNEGFVHYKNICFKLRYVFYDLCLNACLVISYLLPQSISHFSFTVLSSILKSKNVFPFSLINAITAFMYIGVYGNFT